MSDIIRCESVQAHKVAVDTKVVTEVISALVANYSGLHIFSGCEHRGITPKVKMSQAKGVYQDAYAR